MNSSELKNVNEYCKKTYQKIKQTLMTRNNNNTHGSPIARIARQENRTTNSFFVNRDGLMGELPIKKSNESSEESKNCEPTNIQKSTSIEVLDAERVIGNKRNREMK